MKSQTMNLLKKEIKLGNTSQTFIWMLCCFGMFFIPSYPSYIGPFYITLCTMMTFALNQSSHDILYTVLLPVRKIDTVKARFLYCGLVEFFSLVLALIPTFLRYSIPSFPQNHAGINTTPAYFGLQFIVYSVFNFLFLGNVYKNPLKPGVRYFIAAIAYFIMYAVCELPVWAYFGNIKQLEEGTITELSKLASTGQMFTDMTGAFIKNQFLILLGGILIFAGVWILTFFRAAKQFEKYDL
ncbi:MAG: ABC-2 transporter permease [Treponema sp.]|nr:ABC-2 transporter permease [Treponema sp.]